MSYFSECAKHAGSNSFLIPYNRQQLADYLNVDRSTMCNELSKMQKGSNNRNKQRLKVAKLHEKVSNQRKDFLHKQSRQITNAYDCVCIEDLDMKAMSRSLNFGKSVSDNGWGMFTTFLKKITQFMLLRKTRILFLLRSMLNAVTVILNGILPVRFLCL